MPPLPRGRCPVCALDVALRVNGVTREHYSGYLPQAEQDPSRPLGRMKKCEGSGRSPRA